MTINHHIPFEKCSTPFDMPPQSLWTNIGSGCWFKSNQIHIFPSSCSLGLRTLFPVAVQANALTYHFRNIHKNCDETIKNSGWQHRRSLISSPLVTKNWNYAKKLHFDCDSFVTLNRYSCSNCHRVAWRRKARPLPICCSRLGLAFERNT